MQNDTPKARAAYQHFLTLWKDADPDIPTIRQAKAEYKKLTATASTSASVSGRECKEEEWLPGLEDVRVLVDCSDSRWLAL
jgi:hypothetical protein